MWIKWFPWRWIVKKWARKEGFLDPFKMIAQFQGFSQPSEVAVPAELLRLAVTLHARGLINSQAIQYNLDWVWPYWVERQFDPHDPAFIPRAFSLSHINLTHRNWTAVGTPDSPEFPIVDPAGLVTPLFDSWSIDSWVIPESGPPLIPSRLKNTIAQRLTMNGNLGVITASNVRTMNLTSLTEVGHGSSPVCKIHVTAFSHEKAWLVISLRPYNPEGISFIHQINALEEHHGWCVNGKYPVYFSEQPDRCAYSDYRSGDVYHFLPHTRHRKKVVCDVGMATAAAMFELKPDTAKEIEIDIPLQTRNKFEFYTSHQNAHLYWKEILKSVCRLQIPDEKFQYLYDAAVRSLILHSPEEVYPGPYTYKHFWFRDAAFILNAMLCLGLFDRAERVIDKSFFSRLTPFGYFHSQDGEWDSNGQALWTLEQFCDLTGQLPNSKWKDAIIKAGKWIHRKRLSASLDVPHAGLLPAGFSAEHLGPNDYYYWDDFWGVAGLQAASRLLDRLGDKYHAALFENEAQNFLKSIDLSLDKVSARLPSDAIPASPYRRMDTAAIGSLVAGYPLQLFESNDRRLLATTNYLLEDCFAAGGFFHEMSHSGINPYLTLHVAQALLRAGNAQYYEIVRAVADLASPTGQWPEAVHPVTKGGCMGDGQHVWASAEWVMMIRNMFVREEGNKLILFSGIPDSWLEQHKEISFGPAPTKFGAIELSLKPSDEKIQASWKGQWFVKPPELEIHLPGHEPIPMNTDQHEIEILRAVKT